MKYRSMSWKVCAGFFQVRHLLKNVLFPRVLGRGRRPTLPNQLIDYSKDHGETIFSLLISKYPQLQKTKKYVVLGKPYLSNDLLNASIFYRFEKAIVVFWSHVATTDDLIVALKYQRAIECYIHFPNKASHAITVTKFIESSNIFIVTDPLGNMNNHYKTYYGKDIHVERTKLESLNKNGFLGLSIMLDPRDKESLAKLIKLFEGREHYFLSPYDYFMYQQASDPNRFAFAAKVTSRQVVLSNIPEYFEGRIIFGTVIGSEDNEAAILRNNNKVTRRRIRYHSQRDN